MVIRSVLTICMLWMSVKETVAGSCKPKVYKKCSENICYHVEAEKDCKLTWDNAKIKCEGIVDAAFEGKLAIINTRDIHEFLSGSGWSFQDSVTDENIHGDPEMFIGLRREGQDQSGDWIWLDGSNLGTYSNWKPGEPKNDKHCVVIKRKDDIFEWKSKECDKDEKNYICQYNHHCPVGYATVACTKCDRGTYKDSVTTDACSPCPATRTTTVRGSDSVDDCVCKRGYGGSACAPCDIGYYKNTIGPNQCISCGTRKTTTSTASEYKAACVCIPGHTGSFCTPCERGKYKSTNGSDPCVSCGTGRTTDLTGASSGLSCVCDVGHGGSACEKCAIGLYKSGKGPENCTPCNTSFTTLSMGATHPSQCVLTSVERCTLVAEQLMDDHIGRPQFTTIAQYQVVTLDCESGWTYRNAETSRTLTCTGSDTWNRTLEACEVNTECAAIADSERVDCGWSGISRLECETNMCCYVGSSLAVPSCYFKENRSTIMNIENNTCTFHGKKYSFVSTAGPMNTSCPSDYPSLATLRYVAEFHLLRMCLSLLETTEGMAPQDRWIAGRTTSASHHISDLADYYQQSGTDNNCVAMSSRRANGTDEEKPVNLFRKDCSEAAFPICFKHLDVMTLLISQPVTDGSCKEFDVGDYSEISFWQTFTITDPTSKGYSLLQYKMEGLQCEDKTLLFSTTKGNTTTCQKTRSCEVVERMPRSKECFRMCPCDAGHCQSTVVVEPMTNQNQWTLCPLRLA